MMGYENDGDRKIVVRTEHKNLCCKVFDAEGVTVANTIGKIT